MVLCPPPAYWGAAAYDTHSGCERPPGTRIAMRIDPEPHGGGRQTAAFAGGVVRETCVRRRPMLGCSPYTRTGDPFLLTPKELHP